MTGNFKILCSRGQGKVHLFLNGDFDGSGAQQLLYTLRAISCDVQAVLIHTSNLTSLDPFGLNVLRYSLGPLRKEAGKLMFIGRYASLLVKAWPESLQPVCLEL
jgi:anti-anti-sigma regulatory factor